MVQRGAERDRYEGNQTLKAVVLRRGKPQKKLIRIPVSVVRDKSLGESVFSLEPLYRCKQLEDGANRNSS